MIKSKIFILRPYRKWDEKSLIENINDRNVSKFMSKVPYPYTMKDAKKWVNECRKSNKNKTALSFAIDIGGKIIGGIGLMNIEKRMAELGYWLGKKYWNKGIMTEAVKLVTNLGFKKLKLGRIYATIFVKNRASAKALENNGYKFEGLMKKYYVKNHPSEMGSMFALFDNKSVVFDARNYTI